VRGRDCSGDLLNWSPLDCTEQLNGLDGVCNGRGGVPWDHVTALKGKRCKLIIAYEIFCIIDQSNIIVA
jgi:hypothetical protein